MTPKEKRAFEAMEEILIGGPTECELAVVMRLIDAAERRGEERVLRWLRGFWKDPGSELGKHVVGEYRKARRARGGKR